MRDLTLGQFFLGWVLTALALFRPEGSRNRPRHAAPRTRTAQPEKIHVSLAGLKPLWERHPDTDPDLPPVPPIRPLFIALAEAHRDAQWERTQQRERLIAATAVTFGYEYPYTYSGAPSC